MRKSSQNLIILALIFISFCVFLIGKWYSINRSVEDSTTIPTQELIPNADLYHQEINSNLNNKSDTYVNWDNNFSFKIPSSWKAALSDNKTSMYELSCPSCGGSTHGVSVSYFTNKQGTPIDSYIPQVDKYANMGRIKPFESSNAQIVTRVDRQAPGAGDGQNAYIADKAYTKLVSIYCSLCSDNEMNAIITSFSFDTSVIDLLPTLFPSINWQNTNNSHDSKEGITAVSEMGNSDGVYDSTELITKLHSIGWSTMLPDGASGPFTSYDRLSKQINGVDKVLKIIIENTTMTRDYGDKQPPTLCPCINKITVSHE